MTDCTEQEKLLRDLIASEQSDLEFCDGLEDQLQRKRCRSDVLSKIATARHNLARCLAGLTGIWADDVNGLYFIRQIQNQIAWAGFTTLSHTGGDFHLGVVTTHVFSGTLDGSTIHGDWLTVPRGFTKKSGSLSLTLAGDSIHIDAKTGDFPATKLQPAQYDPGPGTLSRFLAVQTFGGGRLSNPVPPFAKLIPYKDFVVVFGEIRDDGQYNFGWTSANRGYCGFIKGEGVGNDDGDLTFALFLSANDRARLDLQPAFWVSSSGWLNPPGVILDKLNAINSFHSEIVMFGRTNDEASCENAPNTLLPGWNETLGNSVLINGIPVDGDAINDRGIINMPDLSGRIRLVPGMAIRLTGAICLDQDHDDKLEIHPVYSIDVIRNAQISPVNLTGAWDSGDGGTYYVRQEGNSVCWLGMSSDGGRTFANVFRGNLADGVITGDWVDVPLGRTNGFGRLTVDTGALGQQSTTLQLRDETGGFGAIKWTKMWDR